MNTRVKGQRAELKAQKELKEEGWFIERAPGSTKWNKQVDLWGIFDLVGLKKIDGVQKRIWAQVKCNVKPSLKPFRKFKEDYCDENDTVEIFVYKDRKMRDRIRV